MMPRFKVIDDNALILGKYRDGGNALAVKEMKDWTSVYCAAPGGLDVDLYHNIVKKTGAFIASRPGVVLAMNADFVSLHALKGGDYHLKLPRRAAKVIDAMTGKVVALNQDYVDLKLVAQQSMWLILK
jgi:hypothetical protein